MTEYKQDGPEAVEIAKHLPWFPFKGIPRFYDIGGFLYEPEMFQKIVDIFSSRYRSLEVDVIAGYVELVRFGWMTIGHSLFRQLGCSRFCFGSSHCSGIEEALHHDEKEG